MKTVTVTVEQVMAQKPCGYNGPDNDERNYTENRVRKLFGRRKKLTVLQVLDLDIPNEDRLWAILHLKLLNDKTLRLFACDCAQRALKRERREGKEPDERSWEAVRVARRFADGKATKEELAAARDAAHSDAHSDAHFAAHSAAHSAAYYSAYSATYSATYYSVYSAARFAVHYASHYAAHFAAHFAAHYAAHSAVHYSAYSVERKWQIARLRKWVEKEKGEAEDGKD